MATHPSVEPAGDDRDQIVLELRRSGRTFAFIARTLNLGKARDANAAFLRAIAQSPARDRQRLRKEELVRLQQLEDTIRGNGTLQPADLDRQMEVLTRLRAQLHA